MSICFHVPLWLRLFASPGAGLCLIHHCIFNLSNVIEFLWVSVVLKEEVGRHEGRRRNGGGARVREGKLGTGGD